MTVAYYPNRIRRWPTHQNLIDDVDASHVNNLQAELERVMLTLGTVPQVYNNIETDGTVTTEVPGDDGSVVDDDTLFTGFVRYYDPKIKPIDHGSVGERLDNIERGSQFHVFRMRANNLDIASSGVSLQARPKGIRFPKPNSNNDPNEMHNGLGVTLRKSGFWLFSGNVVFNFQGATANSNNGIYQAAVDIDGEFLDSMERDEETGAGKHSVLNPFTMGFFNKGARISLRASQNSGRNQKIRTARLSGVLLRESVG
jgi:hypothetical protein